MGQRKTLNAQTLKSLILVYNKKIVQILGCNGYWIYVAPPLVNKLCLL